MVRALALVALVGCSAPAQSEAQLALGGADSIEGTGFTFDGTEPGQSARATFTLANTGSSATGVIDAQLTGDPAFALDASSDCQGRSLAPGDTCQLTIVFAPTSVGNQAAMLAITASPGGMVTLTINGPGIPPPIVLSPSSVDFGAVEVGTYEQVVHVTNQDTMPIAISSISINGPTYSQTSDCGASLPASGACDITVKLAATHLGTVAATLTIDSDGALVSAPVTAAVGGRVTVNKLGLGTGKVTSNTGGIMCGTSCSELVSTGVTLVAAADPGSVFLGWSVQACGSALSCTLPADPVARTITATFAVAGTSALQLELAGNATGMISVDRYSGPSQDHFGYMCSASCSIPVEAGDHVDLIAASPSDIAGWSGACSSTSNVCSLTVTGNATATITFTKPPSEQWTRLLDTDLVVRSADFDSANRLVISVATAYLPVVSGSVIGLDADGSTRWIVSTVPDPNDATATVAAAGRVRLDASDNVYLLARRTLAKLAPDGTFLWSVDLGADADPETWQFASPLAVSPTGDVAVVVGTTLQVYLPSGQLHWQATGLVYAYHALAIDAQGNINVLRSDAQYSSTTVFRFSATGSPLPAPATIAPERRPALAFDSQQSYITLSSSTSACYVQRWLADGVTNTFSDQQATGYDVVEGGVAVDDSDALYSVYNLWDVPSSGAHGFSLRRHSTTGTTTFALSRPTVSGVWSEAYGHDVRDIAIDHQGHVALVGGFIGPLGGFGFYGMYGYIQMFAP